MLKCKNLRKTTQDNAYKLIYPEVKISQILFFFHIFLKLIRKDSSKKNILKIWRKVKRVLRKKEPTKPQRQLGGAFEPDRGEDQSEFRLRQVEGKGKQVFLPLARTLDDWTEPERFGARIRRRRKNGSQTWSRSGSNGGRKNVDWSLGFSGRVVEVEECEDGVTLQRRTTERPDGNGENIAVTWSNTTNSEGGFEFGLYHHFSHFSKSVYLGFKISNMVV